MNVLKAYISNFPMKYAATDSDSSPDFTSDEEDTCSESSYHVDLNDQSDDSEDYSEPETPIMAYLSKDKTIQWYSESFKQAGRASSSNVMSLTPGITRYAMTRISDEISAFKLFITIGIEQLIMNYTNIEGEKVYGENWKQLDDRELEAYLGLLILAGVYKSHNESTESLWSEENGRHIFRATMSLKRFKELSRVLRFDDRNRRRKSDKLAPIQDLWNKWVDILPNLYNPGENVTVDEQLIGFRGRCPFRQYMPKKPSKYGIKFWLLCDSVNSYVWNIQIYTGKDAGTSSEKNQGLRVVLDLCSKELKGRNVTVDNFFTSYDLGQMLLKRNLTMIGTIRKNKTSIPPELLHVKGKAVFSSTFAFTPDTTMVSYIPKKNKCVVLQSTLHKSAAVESNVEKKPIIIVDYNKTKGGVDTLDQKVACYTCKRKTNRWPIVVFANMLDISVNNAFVLFSIANPNWNIKQHHRRRTFIELLGKALIQSHSYRRKHIPRFDKCQTDIAILESENDMKQKRGRCSFCEKSDNKHTSKCASCNKFICKSHTKTLCLHCMK